MLPNADDMDPGTVRFVMTIFVDYAPSEGSDPKEVDAAAHAMLFEASRQMRDNGLLATDKRVVLKNTATQVGRVHPNTRAKARAKAMTALAQKGCRCGCC